MINALIIVLVLIFSSSFALYVPGGSANSQSSRSRGGLMDRRMLRKERRRQMEREAGSGLDLLFQDNVVEEMTTLPSSYEYVPPEVGAEIYVGSIVALVPIVWATYEFTNRIRIQQECLVCSGSGLISVTKSGQSLKRQRKCYNCGGFLPWLGWRAFWFSTFTDVGNGGVLQQPSKDYDRTNQALREQEGQDTNREAAD